MWACLNWFEANSVVVKFHKCASDIIAIVSNNMDHFTSSTIHKTIWYVNISCLADMQ